MFLPGLFPDAVPQKKTLAAPVSPCGMSGRKSLTFLGPLDSPLAGVDEIFKFCLQNCGPLPDLLRVLATGFLPGRQED